MKGGPKIKGVFSNSEKPEIQIKTKQIEITSRKYRFRNIFYFTRIIRILEVKKLKHKGQTPEKGDLIGNKNLAARTPLWSPIEPMTLVCPKDLPISLTGLL